MMKLKHLVLTRFNVAAPGREQSISLKPGWLDGRFDLFEKYCLPSVKNQTNHNFTWVVFFDTATPSAYKQKIERLQRIYPFKAEFTALFEMDRIVPSFLSRDNGESWLLTTRLDSDDILSDDFVSNLQDIAAKPKRIVINFYCGTILSVTGSTAKVYETEDVSNPFASLLEPLDSNSKSIWAVQHTALESFAEVFHENAAPRWMQLVHGTNVSNRVKGKRISLKKHSSRFQVLRKMA